MRAFAPSLVVLALAASALSAGCGQAAVPTAGKGGAAGSAPAAAATPSSAVPSGTPAAGTNGAAASGPSASASPTASPSLNHRTPPPPSASPAPTRTIIPPLPALLGAIGDSISVGYNAVPTVFGAQPAHSWVFGTDPNDGVESQLERIRVLGGRPVVVQAAHAGDRMSDIVRQARLVIERAATLPQGATAYVTIELGANDLCRDDPSQMTAVSTFTAELTAGLAVLRDGDTIDGVHVAGLPTGSRILVLSVPDVLALRRIVHSDPIALAVHERFGQCRAAVDSGLTAADLAAVAKRVVAFDAALHDACARIQSAEGPSGRLFCRDDQDGPRTDSFTGAPFTLADLSRLDYFHPSLEGQARIAAGSWAASYWASALP